MHVYCRAPCLMFDTIGFWWIHRITFIHVIVNLLFFLTRLLWQMQWLNETHADNNSSYGSIMLMKIFAMSEFSRTHHRHNTCTMTENFGSYFNQEVVKIEEFSRAAPLWFSLSTSEYYLVFIIRNYFCYAVEAGFKSIILVSNTWISSAFQIFT